MSKFNDVLNKKAVALSYDENKNAAPIIVASGMGYVAEKMVEVARESGVPIYEDNSLATMLTQLNLGAEIPTELYQAIIDIYVYFLNYVPGKKNEKQIENETEKENEEFLKLLEEAEDKMQQAMGWIIYNNFGNLNNSIKEELKNMIRNIKKIEQDVSSGYEPLYKPVKRELKR